MSCDLKCLFDRSTICRPVPKTVLESTALDHSRLVISRLFLAPSAGRFQTSLHLPWPDLRCFVLMEADLVGCQISDQADACSGRVVKKSVIGAPKEIKTDEEQEPVESNIPAATEGASIAPITPIPAREVRDIRAPRPVVLCRLSSKVDVGAPECYSPRTPKKAVFDPFAPGPDDFLLAPKLIKKTSESRIIVARQLKFDSLSSGGGSGMLDQTGSDEEKLLDIVYDDLLDVIVPSSTDRDVAHNADSDGFKTPPLVPCSNETAKKCPDAPMKQGRSASKRLHIDASLCRKLEF